MLGAVQQAAPILLYCYLGPLLIMFYGEGLQPLQLLRAQMNPFSLKGGGHDLRWLRLRWGRRDVRTDHHHLSRLLRLHMYDHNAAHLLLWPANGT